jgi:hypothetical protein
MYIIPVASSMYIIVLAGEFLMDYVLLVSASLSHSVQNQGTSGQYFAGETSTLAQYF